VKCECTLSVSAQVGVIRRLNNKEKKEVRGNRSLQKEKLLFRGKIAKLTNDDDERVCLSLPSSLLHHLSPSLSPLIVIDINLVAINHMNNNNKSILCFFSSL
jgi:hypothetical protein